MKQDVFMLHWRWKYINWCIYC